MITQYNTSVSSLRNPSNVLFFRCKTVLLPFCLADVLLVTLGMFTIERNKQVL